MTLAWKMQSKHPGLGIRTHRGELSATGVAIVELPSCSR
jgi:hypothetical protein